MGSNPTLSEFFNIHKSVFFFTQFFQFFCLLYLVYTFFELSTISTVLYFDDIFTISTTTLLSSLLLCAGFLSLFVTFFAQGGVFNTLLLIYVSSLLSISLVFGFVLLNDLMVSDVLDIFTELPLTLTGFFKYCGTFFLLVGICVFFPRGPRVWAGTSLLSLFVMTAGFVPVLIMGVILVSIVSLRNYYKLISVIPVKVSHYES